MCNVFCSFCSKLSRALSVRVRSSLIETEKKESSDRGWMCEPKDNRAAVCTSSNLLEHLRGDFESLINILVRVCERREAGFVLRRREVDTALEHTAMESSKLFSIRCRCIGKRTHCACTRRSDS